MGDWLGSTSEVCFAIFEVSLEKRWPRRCVMGLEGRGDKNVESKSKEKVASSLPLGCVI